MRRRINKDATLLEEMVVDFTRQTDSGRWTGFLASWIALAWWSKPVLPNRNGLHTARRALLDAQLCSSPFSPDVEIETSPHFLPCTFLRRRPPGFSCITYAAVRARCCPSVSAFPRITYKPGKVLSKPETSYLSWRVIGITGGKFIIWRSECQRAERCKNGAKTPQ